MGVGCAPLLLANNRAHGQVQCMASVSFSLPEHLVRQLDAVAKAEDRSRSAQLRRLLEAGLSVTAVTRAAGAAGPGTSTGAGPAAPFPNTAYPTEV
jgi:Ribbon-helix-helix protein, copG family